jgi:ankyrin repeat protein
MRSPGARFVGAAADGDRKLLQQLLKDGEIDVNVRDWDDLTALIPAASAGHLDVCKLLVQSGIDVNAADKDGITALMEASIMGHAKIVELLLEKGADVDAAASSEVTALWLAASEGKADVMKILLAKGAAATNSRVDGITALMTASAGGHAAAVKLLLEHGADAKSTDRDRLTALMNAAEKGSVEVLELLIAAVDKDPEYVNAISATQFNALIIASAHGHASAVRLLLASGANVEGAADDSNITALMFAAASNHVDVLKVLIEDGKANLEAKHSNGGTALLEAATGGAAGSLRLLIEKGAVVDLLDDDGVTPLMAVASNGSAEGQTVVLDALKKKMSDSELKDYINLFSKSGGSTVMFAAAGGHLENTKQLIELGADVHAIARATPDYLEKLEKMIADGTVPGDEPHVDGVTALHVAAQGGHLDVVNLLIEGSKVSTTVKDDEGRTALTLAIKGNHAEVATALVKAGADPNTSYLDDEGEVHNLLFDSLMVENDDFAKLLIGNGADIYHKDNKNVSTLLQASHRGLTDVVKALLDKHAENGKSGYLDDASEEGITPLIAAASEGHTDVVKLLVDAKVDINKKDLDETTPLMAAAARGNVDAAKELLAAGAKVNEQNSDGHTALMFVYNGKNQVDTLWERYSQYIKDSGEDGDVDDNGTGPIIREALDKHIALIELLLKNGADPTLKDKEGHTAKDFDYHPDADADVLGKEAKTEKVRDASKYEL